MSENTGWIAGRQDPRRYVMEYDRSGPDNRTFADFNGSDDDGVSADLDAISNAGRTSAIARSADSRALTQQHVATYYSVLMNDQALAVVDIEAKADLRGIGDVDAEDPLDPQAVEDPNRQAERPA